MTPEMRLILEVSHLKNATPATVSRGGVLFINDADVGWKPYFDSWLATYKSVDDGLAENVFTLALTHYLNESFLDDLKNKSRIAPVCDMGMIQSLTCIIDRLNDRLHKEKKHYDHLKKLKEEEKVDEVKAIFEGFFIFALMWSFGASLDEDKLSFSNGLKGMSKIKFPE